MAPKKTDGKKPEGEGPRVYIKVDVSWTDSLLAATESSLLSYQFPNEAEAIQSDRTGTGAPVAGELVRTFIRKPGFLLLHQLLNSPLVLKLLKADGVTAVASAVLDFGPLAQGLDHFSASELHFTAADNKLSLPSDACLDVKV
ncbi:hypothetical protein ABBQ38_007425 [Trebouxia sp. C0009 RCD-2024]